MSLNRFVGPGDAGAVRPATEPEAPYVCVCCRRARLAKIDDGYVCPACGSVFPVLMGVPLLVDGVVPERTHPPASVDADIRRILEYFRLPSSVDNVNALREIFGRRYTFRQQHYTAENNSFMSRISETPLGEWKPERVNENLRAAVTQDYIPEELSAGTASTHNVRIRNDDDAWLVSQEVCNPVFISYHWFALDGRVVLWDGKRTPFPVPLAPHRAMTVPVSIAAPAEPGDYILRLDLAREWLGWGGLEPWERSVRVVGREADPRCPGWIVSQRREDYAKDHEYARTLLQERISGLGSQARILELGGTSSPQTAWFGLPVWNVDIDVQSLQIGALCHANLDRSSCSFVCADAHQLPFEPAYFDCIVMFATLHHFEEPARLLRSATAYLKADGFIAVLCDPVGHDVAGADYRRDLMAGINEQTFTPAEYAMIFDRAGLHVVHAQIDDLSLKAFLGRGSEIP